MGMSVEFYVGPVVICKDTPEISIDKWEVSKELRGAMATVRGEIFLESEEYITYWVPNIDRNQPRDFDLEDHEIFIEPDIVGEIEWFDSEFKQEIDILKSFYSEVRTTWAIIGGIY